MTALLFELAGGVGLFLTGMHTGAVHFEQAAPVMGAAIGTAVTGAIAGGDAARIRDLRT